MFVPFTFAFIFCLLSYVLVVTITSTGHSVNIISIIPLLFVRVVHHLLLFMIGFVYD